MFQTVLSCMTSSVQQSYYYDFNKKVGYTDLCYLWSKNKYALNTAIRAKRFNYRVFYGVKQEEEKGL